MLLEDQKNPGKQGDAGLGIAIGWFAAHGYTVCVPLTDSQEYDLVVENGDGFKRVQVKTTRYRHKRTNTLQVELRTKCGRWSKVKRISSNTDFLFVVTNDTNYLIPFAEIQSRRSLSLGPKYEPYKLGR